MSGVTVPLCWVLLRVSSVFVYRRQIGDVGNHATLWRLVCCCGVGGAAGAGAGGAVFVLSADVPGC